MNTLRAELKHDYRVWKSFVTNDVLHVVRPLVYRHNSLGGVVLTDRVDNYVRHPHITLYCAEVGLLLVSVLCYR